MFQIINRFAWIISLIMGFTILFLFGVGVDEMDGQYSTFLDDDFFFFWIIGSLFFGSLFKKIFLSKAYLKEKLGTIVPGAVSHTSIAAEKKSVNHGKTGDIFEEKKVEYIEELNTKKQATPTQPLKSQKPKVTHEVKEEPSKIGLYIKNFFSENILAKIGSILVFLGVLFLMSLLWSHIGALMKIIIGFVIGFGFYFAGVLLEKKGLKGESRILLGTGLLINYLVILSGKHLLGGEYGFLSTGVTFLFLILNTIFGVVTALLYDSKTLLVFSFLFAYINPLLLGESSSTPYLYIGYSLIVSLGALYTGVKQNNSFLKYAAFILGNLLILISPFNTEFAWISKFIASAFLGFISIHTLFKEKSPYIQTFFILNYIFIILHLFAGGDINILGSTMSFMFYMVTILGFFIFGIGLFIQEAIKSVMTILFFPLFIILGLLFSGSLLFAAPVLAIMVLVYLSSYMLIGPCLNSLFKYLFFIVLGIFMFLTNGFISLELHDLSFMDFMIVLVTSFIFLFTAYHFSTQKNTGYLYSIGTFGGIFTLSPILVNSGSLETKDIFSILAIIIFTLSNIFITFINDNLTSKDVNLKNLIIGSILGVLFAGFQLFRYGNEYFPGVSLGFAFAAFAIFYFIISYLMMNKIGMEKIQSDPLSKNVIFNYIFISISIFSLAIALVFSKSPEIISTVWLFEATILFYFYNKTSESNIAKVGLVLFFIGIMKLFTLVDTISSKEYFFLVSFSIIFISLRFNVKFLDFIKNGYIRVLHDILHMLGILALGLLLERIIPSTGHGWSLFGISLFVLTLSGLYSYYSSKILKWFFVFVFGGFLLLHIGEADSTVRRIGRNELDHLIVLQYLTTLLVIGSLKLWEHFNKEYKLNNTIYILSALYLLYIISFYVFDIFQVTFAITIFWGLLSSLFLFYGISSDTIKFRTMGLYILSFVLTKIFIYDLWYGLDDAVTRVIAFIVIGILLIIISSQYSKKYGNNLKGEFHLSNLSGEKDRTDKNSDKPKSNGKIINQKIADIDISEIDSVKFFPNGEPSFSSKAKNLKKIAVMVLQGNDSYEFQAGELQEVYEYILDNYESDLSKRDFDTLTGAIQDFVKKGGKVELKSNNIQN